MKCACIALLVLFFILFGAGTPYIVYRNTGSGNDTNSTEPVGSGTTTVGSTTTNGTTMTNGTTTNGTATTNGTETTNDTSLSGGPTRRALVACSQTDADALLLGDGTFICTYASGACTYHSETGVLLDDQNGGSCPKEANVQDRVRKGRRGMRYEAIAKRVLA